MEQYYVNDELFNILQECGFIKTEKDLIKEEEEKGKLKEENKKNQENIDLDDGDYDGECPFEAIKENILSLVKTTDSINKKLDTLLNLVVKNKK